jgi:hypothetical protein
MVNQKMDADQDSRKKLPRESCAGSAISLFAILLFECVFLNMDQNEYIHKNLARSTSTGPVKVSFGTSDSSLSTVSIAGNLCVIMNRTWRLFLFQWIFV